jgi:hypothetical protein
MTALKALQSARDLGVVVEVSGDDLLLAASAEPSARIVEDLVRYKPDIVTLLTQPSMGRTAEDWLASFEERAASAEFDGGLP